MDEQGRPGDPIWVRTRSSHCSGPFRWISIQLGVLVTVCRLHNATQHSKESQLETPREEKVLALSLLLHTG